ncbi:MAG TPA: hypothetical protein VMY34_03910 [Acidimicrobiales bacterium]|nr:hypothetical protein [Acidimicrobiales bacterium]
MKKLALALAAAALFVGPAAAALAETVTVPGVGFITTDDPGYVLVAEGDDNNGLGPLSGFISVRGDGQVCADDNGHAVNGDATDDPDSASPTCNF